MSGGVSAIDRELVDYKLVASDLKVGVNHLALDEERIRQEQFFEGIRDLQQRISQNPGYQERYGDEVENLKNGIRLNADVLSYLKSITKLEVPLTDLTNKLTQAAIDASSPKAASQAVFANKALTENVNSCWEYIAQLSLITQAHLKDAASYQQFHHMANEVDAHIDKMIGLAEMKMVLFDPQGTVDESTLLAKELEADHVELARTWEQTCQLTDMARHMKPLQNRLSRVVCGRTVDAPENAAQQVVMVKALIDFSGPDFAIRKGEEMILMNNENPNFWRVKTIFGEREVPSLIFAAIGPNQNEVFRANSLQKKCVSNWKRVLERTKGRLVKYYATLFERCCQNDVVYFAHEDEMNAFLDDVDSILIAPNYDSGILHRAYDKFTNTLMLLSPNRRPPRGAVALTESDIRVLHTPLRLILNHAARMDQVQARVTMTADEVQRYLKSVEDERQHILNEITRMEQLQKEKENQLKSLADRMADWKSKRKAFDRIISDYTSEPIDDILKHFPSTRLAKPNVIENDYRSSTDRDETDTYEPSNKVRNAKISSESSSLDYGQVAKQMVTSHARSKPSGMKFAGVVTQERTDSKIPTDNSMRLKRSASTNDLQTQIFRVTTSTSAQCDGNAGISESNVVYNTEARRQTLLGSHSNSVARLKAELNTKNEKYQNTTDVQAQIIRVTKNAASQVGVRVMPKAIDLSRVDIDNLGLEVQNSSELTGLGLRVGQVLCPVTVGTSVDLFEGPGVQVMGINDVDSINLQLRDSVAHATTDARKRLKVRDVQAQIVSRSNSPATASIRENLLGDTRAREALHRDVQAQIDIVNKAVKVQAVAVMEVVNISSQKPKKRMVEGATTSFCLLPEKCTKSMELTTSEPSTSTVMTQISCLLHSRGIHTDLESYLSDYKKRNGIISETSDLCAQKQYIGKVMNRESQFTNSVTGNKVSHGNLKSSDAETLICKVVHDTSTQVSSKLVPTEVTLSKIKTKNMEVSFVNPLRKVDLDVPVDSLICPADMNFRSELYEGSGFEIADYSGLSNILVTHDGSIARGSVVLDETSVDSGDLQTQTAGKLKTQAAIVLRTDKTKSAIGEVVVSSKYVPKLKFVAADIAAPSFHTPQTPTSDLQTQICDTIRPTDANKKSKDLNVNATDFTRRHSMVEHDYSTKCKLKTQTNVINMSDQNIQVIGEVVCPRCHQRYREIQMQFDSDFKADKTKKFSTQTQICNVVSDIGTQSRAKEMCDGHTAQQRSPVFIDADMQVAVELVPTEISILRCDIENMELELEEESGSSAYKVLMKSVACPAKVKVKPHLVEGSGVHIVGINNASKIGVTVCSDTTSDTKRNNSLANGIDSDAYGELQASVTFEPPVRTISLYQGEQNPSKSTQQSPIRLIPRRLESQKSVSSDTVTQIFSVTTDASVQVGTQLVPQAIGISPVHLENMVVSMTSKSRKSDQTLSASTLLYPAQVELKGRLIDEQSGIEVVPLEQVKVLSMSRSEVDPLVHYAHPSSNSDAITQIETQIPESKKSNLLPASLVMGTGQFDGRRRTPEFASQSLVCKLLSDAKEYQDLTIRLKPVPKMSSECIGDGATQHLGYVAVEAKTQNAVMTTQKLGEIYLPVQKTPPSDIQRSVKVQVGTKLVPKALKICQIPITNLKLESTSPSLKGRQSFSLQAARCPAEITMKTELCEDSGIFICSLDQSEEAEVGMSSEPVHTLDTPRMVSGEQLSKKINLVSGCWSSTANDRAPLLESKSMQNAVIRLPVEGIQATSSNLFSNESSLTLQAETILRPECNDSFNQKNLIPTSDPNPQLKLVAVNASTQSTSKSVMEAVNGSPTPYRQLSAANSSMASLLGPDMNDHGIQVGVRLVPTSVEIKPIKVENMEAVLTSKTTRSSNDIDVSAILCTSGIHYNEVLAEASGVHVVQIDNGDDISLNYCGDRFTTSKIVRKNGEIASSSADGNRSWMEHGVFSKTSANYLQPSKYDNPDFKAHESGEFVTALRVKDAQYSAEHSLVSGFMQDKVSLNGKVDFVYSHIETRDKDVQVGLKLVPKAVTVESVRMENFNAVNEGKEMGDVEQISASAMLCSKPTQYDEILTESKGVTVLPIEAAKDIQIAHERKTYHATVEPRRDLSQQGSYAGTHADPSNAYFAGPQTRIRVHHTQFSAKSDRQNIDLICDNSRPKVKIDCTTQVGATFIPTQIKMQQVRLDTQRVQSLTGSSRTETVLCPTDMSIFPILNECSGVQIAATECVSEILIQMAQGQFSTEVLNDSRSKQMCIALKKESIPKSRELSSEVIPLLKPTVGVDETQRTESMNRMTGSTACTMSSKLVQVGTLLIPTGITMEKVKVNNLEIEVPLSPVRSAEVSVSAVLASSATELISVLTSESGIQVVPMSKVDAIGIHVNGERYIGTVDASAFTPSTETFQKSGGLVDSSSTCAQDTQRIVIPISGSNMISSTPRNVEGLLRKSKDLSQLHEALHSVQTRPSLREANSLSVPSYCRPGLLRVSEQHTTPVTGLMTIPPKRPVVETRDDSVQVGLNLVPQMVEARVVKPGDEEAALTQIPGITVAEFKGNMSARYNNTEYQVELGSDASIPLVNRPTSPYRDKSVLEVSRKSYIEKSMSGIPKMRETSIGPVNKRLISSASQVGTLLVPVKVCMDKIAVDQLAVDIPLTEWRTTDLSVSAILASTATEMVPVITDTTGIQIIEMKDLEELGIQVGDEVYVASVVAPPVKYVNAAYGPTREFAVGAKSSNRKQEVVFISAPKTNETAHLTHKAKNLLDQSAELRNVHSLLTSSSFQPRLRIMSKSGTSIPSAEGISAQQSTTSRSSEHSIYTCPCGRQYVSADSSCRPITGVCNSRDTRGVVAGRSESATEKSRIQESYHVACEATIKPEMFSKRLTANVHTSSNDVRSQFNSAVPRESSSVGGTTDMPEMNINQETQLVPETMTTREEPLLRAGTHCTVMHRDSLAIPTSSKGISREGVYVTDLIEFGDSQAHFGHQQANDMTLETLRGTNEAATINQTPKRTHSADSRPQKMVEHLCVNCQNKLLLAETSTAESHDSNSVQAAIIIRRSSDVDLFETSHSTSITEASIFQRSFFPRDSGKRLSGSFESLGSQLMTTKCVMCHIDLTSGDLSTSIRTSTSSLLASEAVVNTSLKEVAKAYARICRATGQFEDSAEPKERTSLYQALKHNRIIQAVIADYEKDKNKEGLFFIESKEIADVVATTDRQTNYCPSEPSTYSCLKNNTLVKKVVESYKAYKHNQGKDNCTQTGPTQLVGVTFASSDVQKVAEVVEAFEKSEGQVSSKGGLYANLKENPIIQRVIKEYEVSKGAYAAMEPSIIRAEAEHSSTAASKIGIISVDGQVAKMESEQFASTDSMTRSNFPIIRRIQRSRANENLISSSVSSDSDYEDNAQNWTPTQRSPTSSGEQTRFDVTCSALITPETWDKKVQVDSTYQH
ncbi:hypothetical protein ECG_06496 [Echinococcus granulosus]|nr:hypothetical protein ECG_06496 [Echinococcus granulosus]